MMDRRAFLSGCSASLALMALNPIPRLAFGDDDGEGDILIVVFLRGGCDGLHFVGPVSDRHYADARPRNLRVEDSGQKAGIPLEKGLSGAEFRLHADAGPFGELYNSGDLAILHACGLPNGTRSHFDAMELIEKGLLKKQGGSHQGWMSRYLAAIQANGRIPALAAGSSMPLSLLGYGDAVSLDKVKEYELAGDPRLKGILKKLYQGDALVDRTARNTLSSIKFIQEKVSKNRDGQALAYQPSDGVSYPEDWYARELSQSLKTVAQLIKMDTGLRVATVDFGGWDTHQGQGWRFSTLVKGLSRTIMAFYNDLSNYHNRMKILVMSEFGRRLKANRSHGTDHGFGNVMFIIGGQVKGRSMYGQWPGLETGALDNGVDLAVTTDYRTVLAELIRPGLKSGDLETVFPGFSYQKPLGFL